MDKKGKQNCKNNFWPFFRMRKKGIMVKFLTVTILAILIFAPACMLSAKIFRTSTQAKNNFQDFVKELNGFVKDEKKTIGYRGSTVLIMDKVTAIVYFEKEQKELVVKVDGEGLEADYDIKFKKPDSCEEKKNCFCLLRKSEYEIDRGFPGYYEIIVTPQRFLCTNLDYNLELESCSIGEPHDVNSYQCEKGFMIERHLAKEESLPGGAYYENPRRSLIYLQKLDNTVRLSGTVQNE